MPSTKRFAELTFAALAAGIIFAAGQATRLGWLYLNTFTYKDFLLYALILPPIIFLAYAIKVLLYDRLTNSLANIIRLLQPEERQRVISVSGRGFWIALIVKYTTHLVLITTMAAILLYQNHHKIILGISVIALASLTTLRILILRQPLKLEYIPSNDKQSESNPDIDQSVKIALGIVGMFIFIFCAGAVSIEMEDLESVDSVVIFNESTSPIYVNILASNSNSIAYWYNDDLHISTRSNIHTVTKLNSFFGSRKKQADSDNSPPNLSDKDRSPVDPGSSPG